MVSRVSASPPPSVGAINNGYVVVPGDTLSAIAARQGVSLQQLIAANPQIANPNVIVPGQMVNIPAGGGMAPESSGGRWKRQPGSDGGFAPGGPKPWPQGGIDPASLRVPGEAVPGEAVPGEAVPSEAVPSEAATGGASAGGVSAEELMAIVPTLSFAKAREVAQHLSVAMREADITTLRQKAAFIAQLAHESGGFHYMEEIASGAAYEGRHDLGNTNAGDGMRFKGRGYIQVTGRANYTAASQALGIDFVSNPALAGTPENAARIAAWFWKSRGLSQIAESGNFDEVTRRINGGFNGKAARDAYYQTALGALQNSQASAGSDVDNTAAPAGGSLVYGDSGPQVEALQRRLVELGYLTQEQMNTGPGQFGPRTERALRDFQEGQGVSPSGALDAETAAALGVAAPVERPRRQSGGALPVDVSEASGIHVNQFAAELQVGLDGANSNCGPTSIVIAMKALGIDVNAIPGAPLRHDGDAVQAVRYWAYNGVDDSRDGVGGGGYSNAENAGYTEWSGLLRGAQRSGAQANMITASPSAIAAALEQGKSIVISGLFNANSWQARGGATYHLVAVTGMTPDGGFIVNDPCYDGPIAVTASQLAEFMAGNAGAMALST